jgi:hypothetical protein
MKPRSFPASIPKTHFSGFNIILYRQRFSKVSWGRWSSRILSGSWPWCRRRKHACSGQFGPWGTAASYVGKWHLHFSNQRAWWHRSKEQQHGTSAIKS